MTIPIFRKHSSNKFDRNPNRILDEKQIGLPQIYLCRSMSIESFNLNANRSISRKDLGERFGKETEDLVDQLNGQIELFCGQSGYQPPKVWWLKNGVQTGSNRKAEIREHFVTKFLLRIFRNII